MTVGVCAATSAAASAGAGVCSVVSPTAVLLLAVPEEDQTGDEGEDRPDDRGDPRVRVDRGVREERATHELGKDGTGLVLEHELQVVVRTREPLDAVED